MNDDFWAIRILASDWFEKVFAVVMVAYALTAFIALPFLAATLIKGILK